MTSALGELFGYYIYFLIGNPLAYDFGIVNIPFIVGCIFFAVLFYDICHMLGVLIHG